jgi:hypothetical protein
MATEHGHPDQHGPINHETTDINLEGTGKLLVGFVIFMTLVAGAMYGAFWIFERRTAAEHPAAHPMADVAAPAAPAPLFTPANEMGLPGRSPAGPRLLTNEPANLRQFRTEQTEALTRYGWVDQANNVVRVPISRAIELVADRGLPTAVAADPAAGHAMPGDDGAMPANDGAMPAMDEPVDAAPVPTTRPAEPEPNTR